LRKYDYETKAEIKKEIQANVIYCWNKDLEVNGLIHYLEIKKKIDLKKLLN
jgi:5,10-methylene-tetrahydrofolate dehydrogenase/methenyl tetrahydrofolate cyclohydrolase